MKNVELHWQRECHSAGNVEQEWLKKDFAQNVGGGLEEGAKFCSNCGTKVENIESTNDENAVSEDDLKDRKEQEAVLESGAEDTGTKGKLNEGKTENIWQYGDLPKDDEEKKSIEGERSLLGMIKDKLFDTWNGLDKFCKVCFIGSLITIIMFLVAIFQHNGLVVVFSILQLFGCILALLFHKGIVKSSKKYLKYIILAITVLIVVFNLKNLCFGNAFHMVTSIKIPIGKDDCIGEKYSDIETILTESGFTNISKETIEDLSPSETDKVGQIEGITIDGKSSFKKDDIIKSNAEIVIKSHSYKKCNVNMHVNFTSNFLFNKYDVEIFVDDISRGKLEHGEDGDFELAVDPGEYSVKFVSEESSSVTGETTLNVDGDVNVSYEINCYSNEISVDVEYIENLGAVGENEIMMPASMSDYKGKNYKTVKKEFEKLGFTKIKTKIAYDISFGITEEGETKSVSIGGVKAFNRGDIFPNSDKVIITYHMKEEDDPERIAEEKAKKKAEAEEKKKAEEEAKQKAEEEAKQKAEEETTEKTSETAENAETEVVEENLTIDNCPELATMLSNKADMDSSYADFATKYQGRTIEFDGSTDYCTAHEGYTTRFDYLLSVGDYNPDHATGPSFKFNNVNINDLHTDMDTVGAGLNVHIIATVESYDSNSGLFYLDPVSVTKR